MLILCVVSPVFQRYDADADAVRVIESPVQKRRLSEAVIKGGGGSGRIVIGIGTDGADMHPKELKTTTE
jgi:hypothetical protein